MRLSAYTYFLTLVLACLCMVFTDVAEAAPETSMEPPKVDMNPAQVRKDYRLARASIDGGYADRTTNVTAGYAWGKFEEDEPSENTWVLGIGRTNYNSEDSAQEYGIELNGLNLLGVHWGYKKFCCFTEYYEPFYKIGIAAYYDPEDGLANIIDYEKYLLRGSIGFENLFRLKRRLRFEVSAGIGPIGLTGMAHFTYVIPD